MLQQLRDKIKRRPGETAMTAPSASAAPPENRTLLEAFEWYSPADGTHWTKLRSALPSLAEAGITHLWLPPGCKASAPHSNGYDTYDLWDLGEFDQKGHVATKWGSKAELLALCRTARECGVGLLWDAVLNHKAAGDYTQRVRAVEVDAEDRRRVVGEEREVEAWVGFEFAGRGGKYSGFRWNESHFNGTDWDQGTQERGVFKLLGADGGKEWSGDVDTERGNFDYLLCHNVDLAREDVREEYARWVGWMGRELGLEGVRYDAVKHMSRAFMKDHLRRVGEQGMREWWMIGEYCTGNVKTLEAYADEMEGRMMLFDFPLNSRMQGMGSDEQADFRTFFAGTLVGSRPRSAVTFVHNHDNQLREDQPTHTHITSVMTPIAYGIILLMASGTPQIFHGDLWGVAGPHAQGPSCEGQLAKLTLARRWYAYGPEHAYFEARQTAGLTRAGHASRSGGAGIALLANIGSELAEKRMSVGKQHAGERWVDFYGGNGDVAIDERGWGRFRAKGQGMGVWVDQKALKRELVEPVALQGF